MIQVYSVIVTIQLSFLYSLIVYIRFSTLTACLSSMFLSGPFHGKFYNLLETTELLFLLQQVRWHENGVNLTVVFPGREMLLPRYLST